MTPFLLHHLLTESAQRRPEAVAVRHQDQQLSYGDLEARSNQVARALREAGVRPGARVGIHLGKSPAALVAVYGILKTGACYVPVDINAPGPRLLDIARQCGMRHMVTSAAAAPKLAARAADPAAGADPAAASPLAHVFFADALPSVPLPDGVRPHTFGDAYAAYSPEPLDLTSGTDQDLAYILFTSGSTGRPKGVMLSHLNALTFVKWGRDTFGITAEDRLSNHAPLSFDLSVFDLFVAARAGAAVHLIPDGLASFPVRLADLAQAQRLTVWYSVPSVLTLLLTHGKLAEHDLSALRLVLFAGEVFPVKYLRQVMQVLPHPRYANLYGPTETNVITWYDVPPIPEEQTAPISIGRACANTEVIVIDEQGQRVLPSEPGREGLLYARGSTVMQGYWGRPEDTARTFIPNPFAEGREERLYCTGDWVAWDERGDLTFLGRRDHMVKTRGYRVELGEIETVLYQHPGIREAAAIAVPDDLLGNLIAAFVVPETEGALDEQEVKRHCARALPRYMVPETIQLRPSLPRTATDKVDRPRLLAEVQQEAAAAAS